MREIFALRRPRAHSSVGVVGGAGEFDFEVSYETVCLRITMSSDSRVQGLG